MVNQLTFSEYAHRITAYRQLKSLVHGNDIFGSRRLSTYTARPVCWSAWISDSYCSLKSLCSGMGEVVPARTSPTLLPHPLALCCHYPVSKCYSASIVVTGTVRVRQKEYAPQIWPDQGLNPWPLDHRQYSLSTIEPSETILKWNVLPHLILEVRGEHARDLR